MEDVLTLANNFIREVDTLEINQKAAVKAREYLHKSIEQLTLDTEDKKDKLDITSNAIVILRDVSDESVKSSYKFIEDNLNIALDRIFKKSTRKIKLVESTRSGQYPQLDVQLIVENGKVRSLKSDSGHGIMQIISLLCVLSLICITGSRRLLVIDEILGGLSSNARRIIDEILWTFTEVGFQFVVCEHGFVPKNSKVYFLDTEAGISKVIREFIEADGLYLDKQLEEVLEEQNYYAV